MKHITILCTSDIHGSLWGYDYINDKETPDRGMSRLFTYVNKVRREEKNVILIDGGDIFHSNPIFNKLNLTDSKCSHPTINVMNLMEYDAMTLGNHDFDFGIPVLKEIFSRAKFPVLAANIKNKNGNTLTGKSYTIIDKEGIKIAIIGVVTPFIPVTSGDKEDIKNWDYLSGTLVVREILDELKDKADVFIVSAHMGGYGEYDPESGSDSAWQIALDNPEIHFLQMAHTHEAETGKKGEVLYGETRDQAREILRFDFDIDDNKNIINKKSEIISAKDYEPSGNIINLPALEVLHQEMKKLAVLESNFMDNSPVVAVSAASFQPENPNKDFPIARFQETPLVTLINEMQLYFSQADVSACTFPDTGVNIPRGNITKNMLDKVYKYPNYLIRVPLTGAELIRYLEWNANCYLTLNDGDEVKLNPDFPDFLQDYFSGVDFEIHVRNPFGDRIKNVMFKGKSLDPEGKLTFATNNYRFNTTLKKEGIISGQKEWESEKTIRELLEDYIVMHSPISPKLYGNWRIII